MLRQHFDHKYLHSVSEYRIFVSSMTIKQKITIGFLSILALPAMVASAPVFAADECPKTSIIKVDCDNKGGGVWGILTLVINIMTAGIGIAAVGGLIYAGITYTTASNDSAKVAKAKEMIFNVVLGLVLYALMWSFIQYLIPGGIFK